MEQKKSRTDLIFDSLNHSKAHKGKLELDEDYRDQKKLRFHNLNVDSLKPSGNQIEYSSVKLRAELYEKIRKAAEKQGVRQPGRFISLILEAYLKEVEGKQTPG